MTGQLKNQRSYQEKEVQCESAVRNRIDRIVHRGVAVRLCGGSSTGRVSWPLGAN